MPLKPPNVLKQEIATQKELDDEKRRLQMIETHEWYKKHLMKEAKGFLEDKLPLLIERQEKAGIREVIEPSGSNYSGDMPNDFFNPEGEHTKWIIQELEKLEYKAEVLTKHKQNFYYEPWGDGEYNTVDAPGTHEEYQLKVTWK